jgi:hypothetical protein
MWKVNSVTKTRLGMHVAPGVAFQKGFYCKLIVFLKERKLERRSNETPLFVGKSTETAKWG